VAHNHPVGDDILGVGRLVEGGRYFGAPSYHDYLQIPESAGRADADPPYSNRRYNCERRIAGTDRNGSNTGFYGLWGLGASSHRVTSARVASRVR
jgi:hypothetical protein